MCLCYIPILTALRMCAYVTSRSLFCYPARSRALSKQRLSHLLMEAISLVWGTKCLSLPQGVGTHSTSGMATSWALFKGFPVSVLFVLQLAYHHHTLVWFYCWDVTAHSVVYSVLSAGSTMWCWSDSMYICPMLYVLHHVNRLKGDQQLCL